MRKNTFKVADEETDLDDVVVAHVSTSRRIMRVAMVLLVLAGLLYISGLHQLFLYQRTPRAARGPSVEALLDVKAIMVPLSIFVLQGPSTLGSERTEYDVRELVRKTGDIWVQGNITFTIKNIIFHPLAVDEETVFRVNPTTFFESVPGYDPKTINVFLTGTLFGINGIAFEGSRSVIVADYTTVPDFRALAHEIGHIFGLSHTVEHQNRLLYQGASGSLLTLEEVKRARDKARQF
jgi:hypothetical protein